MKTILRKIPGALPPPPKNEIDGKITNLSSKSVPELLELLDRQQKLLSNKPFISKLPDRGSKLQALYDKINQELKSKQEEDQTCRLLENLNLTGEKVQDLEWEQNSKQESKTKPVLDSDDDSDPEDVLHILSQSTAQEKIIKVIPPEKPLITSQDLKTIGEVPHVQYIVHKTETKPNLKPENFKPFKTTKSDVHNPKKEIQRKKGKHWEVTAATPPPIIHGPARVLPIEESLKLQKEQNKHLKEVEAQHAAERLIERMGVKIGELPDDLKKLGKYRDVLESNTEESDPEGSDKEVHDEEPERGGVVFTVMK